MGHLFNISCQKWEDGPLVSLCSLRKSRTTHPLWTISQTKKMCTRVCVFRCGYISVICFSTSVLLSAWEQERGVRRSTPRFGGWGGGEVLKILEVKAACKNMRLVKWLGLSSSLPRIAVLEALEHLPVLQPAPLPYCEGVPQTQSVLSSTTNYPQNHNM